VITLIECGADFERVLILGRTAAEFSATTSFSDAPLRGDAQPASSRSFRGRRR